MTDAIDYNALDDTFAGQLAQGGFIAAMFAVPDLISHRGTQIAAWAGLAALNIAAVGLLNAVDEDPAMISPRRLRQRRVRPPAR